MAPPARIGKYAIERLIDHGGQGTLYLGRDPFLDRPVAIKVLRDLAAAPGQRQRFERELSWIARLHHPNIVTVYEAGLHDDQPFMAMEYVDGETLAALIQRKAPLSLAHKLRLIEEACCGLEHVHAAGFIHRDVKPSNIMVDRRGWVKVLDFGIARAPDSSLTEEGDFLGTLSYMPPEQLLGQPVDERTDLYAAAAVLYELVSGEPAFRGDIGSGGLYRILHEDPTPLQVRCPDIPPALDALVRQALQKEGRQRPADVSVFRRRLADIRASLESHQRVQPFTVSVPDWRTAVGEAGSGVAVASSLKTMRAEQVARPITTGEFTRAMRTPSPGRFVHADADARPHAAGARWLIGGAGAVGASVALGAWLLSTAAPDAQRLVAMLPARPDIRPLTIVPLPVPSPSFAADPTMSRGPIGASLRPPDTPAPVATPPPPSVDEKPVSTAGTIVRRPDVPTIPLTDVPIPPAPSEPPPAPGAPAEGLAPTKSVRPAAEVVADELKGIVTEWSDAMTGRDPLWIQRIYPSVNVDDLARQFSSYKRWRVQAFCRWGAIVVTADSAATVNCSVNYNDAEVVGRPGRQNLRPAQGTMTFVRRDGRWVIDTLNIK